MPGPWERYQTAPAGTSAPRPLPAPPRPVDPYAGQQEQRAAASDARAAGAEQRAVASENRAAGNQSFDQNTALIDRYNRDTPISNYTVAVNAMAGALNQQANPAGDLALVYAYAKMMDPESVVREGEAASVSNSDTTIGQASARFAREFGLPEGGLFRPEQRQRLLRAMNDRLSAMNAAYNQRRSYWSNIATANGQDPTLLFGEHAASPFRERYQAWRQRNGLDGAAPPGVVGQQDDRPVPEGVTVEGVDPQTGERYGVRADGTPWAEIRGTPDISQARGSGGIGEAVDAFVRGAADTASFGAADEFAGTMNAIASGDETRDQGINRERAIDQYDANNNTASRITGQIAGAFLNPLGGLGAAVRGARGVATVGGLAREGALYGGLYGFGSGEGGVTNRLESAGVGAAVGAGGGAVLGAGLRAAQPAVNAVATRFANREAARAQQALDRQQLLGDFGEQGVTALPANVGGASVNRMTAAGAQSPIGGGRITEAFSNQRDELGAAVARAGEGVGTGGNTEVVGGVVRGAGERMIERTRAVGNALYERAARMAGDTRITPATALQTIDDELTRLNETPEINAPLIAELQRFRASLANADGISVDGIRTARTIAGRAARTEALRSTDAQRSLGNVMTAISGDIQQGLRAAGRGNAAAAFRRADDLWRERIDYIDRTLEPLIGRGRSGESIMATLQGYASNSGRGNAAQLRRVLRELEPNELGDVQATVIERMGRARAGQQNATGDAFSPETFLSNWNSLSPQGRNALFQGELRQNLDQIARVAESLRDTGRYANRSNTGSVVWQSLLFGGGGGAGAGLVAGSPSTALAGMGAAALAGGSSLINSRLMTSPGFTRWLARMPRGGTPPASFIRRLETIATREPVVAADIRALQLQLEQAFAQSPSRAAASGQQEENRRQIPPQ